MAKKKGKPAGGRPGGHNPSSRDREGLPPLPDRRMMEKILHQLLPGSDPGRSRKASALEEAQEVMYDAFEAPGDRGIRLAQKALSISPDCADAYVFLAEQTRRLEDALQLYEEGVAAGERALGKKAFREYEGSFWGFLETRPYMRARFGLAQCLWEAGRREEAVAHYTEMLRLNPNDNQGVRYVLAACLLDLGQQERLERLLNDYREDGSVEWAYTRALVAYRKEGDASSARKLLSRAMKTNRHVPAYLLGNKAMPASLPEYITLGGEDEAVSYVGDFMSGWRSTPGALGWLRKTLKLPVGRPQSKRKPSWPELRLRVARLPQEPGEVWQVDCRSIAASEEDPELPVPRWALIAVEPSENVVVNLDLAEEEPTAAEMWDYLLSTMLRPKHGEPRRPQTVQVRPDLAGKWRSKLTQVRVECLPCSESDKIDSLIEAAAPALERMVEELGETRPGEFAGEMADLPQEVGEVWQADVRKLPAWTANEGDPQRPWVALVTNRSEDLVLAHDLRMDPPGAHWLWENLSKAMLRPAAGPPHRPGIVEVNSPEFGEALRSELEAAGIRCVVRDELDHLDFVLKDMAEHLGGPKPLAALVDVPGMTLEQVGGLFSAAADFYRRAPWRDVPGDTPIRVECDKFQSGPWYAVVMGQRGMTLGLALYEDLESLRQLLSGDDSEEESSRRMSGLSLMYGEAFEIPVADLDAAEKHGWPVAAPEAYPEVIRVNPGRAIRPALPWELELLEGCLRAIPEFLAAKTGAQAHTVATAKGNLTLRLCWLKEL